MKINQLLFRNGSFQQMEKQQIQEIDKADLVLGFGSKSLLGDGLLFSELQRRYPSSQIVLGSSAGEICSGNVFDDSVSVTVLQFEKTRIQTACVDRISYSDSFAAGKSLIEHFDTNDLSNIFIVSDGLQVNGSQLVKGMEAGNHHKVVITGGLAGDSTAFAYTTVGLNAVPSSGKIVAIGFYGKAMDIRYSSFGGWDVFGPERTVTKSNHAQVYEIDGRSATELYRTYTGPYMEDSTFSTLFFPLSVKLPNHDLPLVRSVLSVDETNDCLNFSGDVPEGSLVRFMKASFDKLIDAAEKAAEVITDHRKLDSPDLAILISCVGRKSILEKRVSDEVEMIAEHFGERTAITGFYSYGEISPQLQMGPTELHNQTMTITTFTES